MSEILLKRVYKHAHFFCGLGGGARGFNQGTARVGNLQAEFRCIGGFDVDPASIRDFERLAGVPGTVIDLFSLEQYIAFHGRPPPPGWREATVDDIRRGLNYEFPDVVFLSAPCKGFSGLLAEKQSKTDKYQALNGLTLRGMMLMCEAFKDDPPALIIFENVPRIATRGAYLLQQIEGLLRGYGYAVFGQPHNCGEIGNLAQSRERYLLVARYMPKVPNFLYEPPKRPLRGVGEVLDRMPLPGDLVRGGPMHRVPALQWKTWVRLAFVEAGKDWRSLNNLQVEDGFLKDFAIAPEVGWNNGVLGVTGWQEHAGVVTSNGRPGSGNFSVADPRVETGHPKSVQLGVRPWNRPAPVIKGDVSVGTGPYAVADPRMEDRTPFNHVFRIVPAGDASPAVHGGGGYVADPRGDENRHVGGKYRITGYDEAANTVIAGSTTGNGAFALADPRVPAQHDGNLGVLPFDEPVGTIKASAEVTTGRYAVADPRPAGQAADQHGKYRVTLYDEASRAVIAGRDNGATAVADPRVEGRRNGALGVLPYDQAAGVVGGESLPPNGTYAVADPRPTHGPNAHTNKHKVIPYDGPAVAVTGSDRVGSGALSVADPRMGDSDYVKTKYQVTPYDGSTRAVIGASTAGDGAYAVADPRPVGLNADGRQGKHVDHYGVLGYDETSGAVIGSGHPWDNGRWSVADPRPAGLIGKDVHTYANQAHYGVVPYTAPAGAVTAFGQADNGKWSVADERAQHGGEPVERPRTDLLPGLAEQLVCVIIARDGTWHRPFTTLELAALQSLYDPEDVLELDGRSDSAWRERIGNAVPSAAAKAMADVFADCLLRAEAGESFKLSNESIWVRQMQIGLSVDLSGQVPA